MATFDIEFEDNIIAAALQDEAFVKRAARICDSHHFGTKEHGWLWKVVADVWSKYRERVTPRLILARAREEFPDEDDRKPYISLAKRLFKTEPESPSAALEELGKFVRFVNLQLAIEEGVAALEKGDADAAEKALNKGARNTASERTYTHIRWIEEFGERQSQRQYEKEHPEEIKVVPTGMKRLDKALGGGGRVGELGLVMGTTGRGKSIMLQNIAYSALKRSFGVAHFALEMPARQVAARQDSLWSGVYYSKFKTWDFKPSELRALERRRKRTERMFRNRYHIFSMPVRSADIRQVYGALDDLAAEYDFRPEVIIMDSGDHLRAVDKSLDSFRLQQAEVYWDLKRLAEEEGYVVWSSVHAGREWATKTATAEATAEAYDKARIADTVISINDPSAGTGRRRRAVEVSDEDDESEEPEEVKDGSTVPGKKRLQAFLAKYRDGDSNFKFDIDCDFARMLIRDASEDEEDEVSEGD